VRSSRWAPIAGWCAATASSIVLASVALLPVLRTAAPEDSALSTIDQLSAATSFPVPLPSVARTSASATPGSSNPRGSPSRTPGSTPSTRTAPTRTKAPVTTTEDGWTVTSSDDGVRTCLRSFKVTGGQAVIKMTSDGVVTLVTATPADGYAVQKTQSRPDDLAVYFNEANHSFIIHATWWNDAPFAQLSEVGQ
jgi:hypothetical protein